jgi:hypothetical protein
VTPPVTPPAVAPSTATEQPEAEDTESPEVLGVQAFGDDDSSGGSDDSTSPSSSSPQSQQLPTAVNAGAPGATPVGPSPVEALLGLLMVLVGGALARLGWRHVRG